MTPLLLNHEKLFTLNHSSDIVIQRYFGHMTCGFDRERTDAEVTTKIFYHLKTYSIHTIDTHCIVDRPSTSEYYHQTNDRPPTPIVVRIYVPFAPMGPYGVADGSGVGIDPPSDGVGSGPPI